MCQEKRIIEVAVNLPVTGTFHYSVPPHLDPAADIGKRVRIPFHRRNGIIGYIIGNATHSDRNGLRDISGVLDEFSLFPESMIPFFRWISDYYQYPLGEVIHSALPGLHRYAPMTESYLSPVPHMDSVNLSGLKKIVFDLILSEGEIRVKELNKRMPSSARMVRSLIKSGHLRLVRKTICRKPFGDSVIRDTPLPLTEAQQQVVRTIVHGMDKGFGVYVLAGVTGSGKTEVYLQLAAEVIRHGLSVLVLVPEIALISQTQHRFRARFGERVAILHSGLSVSERYDQWMRIATRETPIAIGARSAIFAPFSDLGLIIVDEEHDPSYKQETDLLYNARDLAIVRAKFSGCTAVLGSATPSIQSLYNVQQKKYILLLLNKRIEDRPLPNTTVVDLRNSRDQRGIRRFISQELYQAMKETLAKQEQCLIFLNRRGFSSFSVCDACGEPIRCQHCDISLTLHQSAQCYKCHFCGFVRPLITECSQCGSSRIQKLGFGTEKVETAIKALFPEARVTRMDRDTTGKKGSAANLLKGLNDRTTDILIGTQMIAKGHDFPNITLVGIICADLSLNFPDFRAAERTFQLLAQVSGRAGRGDMPGRVILQTYSPEHYSILAAKNQDYQQFYDAEIRFRKDLAYPPFSRIIRLKISGKDQQEVQEFAHKIGRICQNLKQRLAAASVGILGPVEAYIPRIAARYRWQILLKGRNTSELRMFIQEFMQENANQLHRKHVNVIVDVDPYYMT